MLSIGEFARLAGVSVRMLRHYDGLGLLVPDRVDPFSGYRSYAASQLDRANQLVALKDLGFPLEQVGELLDDAPPGRVAELLRERRNRLREQLDADQRRLMGVEMRLRSIEKEIPMSEFTLTPLPALRLVQVSAQIEEMEEIENEIGPMFDRVNAAIGGAARVGPGVATYTDIPGGLIAAAGEQIGEAPTPEGLEKVDVAEAPRALTVTYEGEDIAGLPAAWQSLVREVESRGLVPVGTCREVYLETPYDPEGERWRISLQQPVAG